MSTRCPFCGGDPYHYEDIGTAFPEPVAVTCCELGIEWFKPRDEAPGSIPVSWEDFDRIARVFEALRTLGMQP